MDRTGITERMINKIRETNAVSFLKNLSNENIVHPASGKTFSNMPTFNKGNYSPLYEEGI